MTSPAMLRGGVDAAVVEAVIRLGSALRVSVVAEGVEDAETAERLTELGCPFGQGFYFGRPEPVAALAARLTKARSVDPVEKDHRDHAVGDLGVLAELR